MDEVKIPAPYPRQISINPTSPWSLRCDEIDDAVALVKDPDAFAQIAADKEQLVEGGFVHLEKPKRQFFEGGGCPAFGGILNSGCPANVVCKLTEVQLHGYVEVKLCSAGRNFYCPIWKAKRGRIADG